MSFTTITHVPGEGIEHYRQVAATLGDQRPPGLLIQLAGEADSGLRIVSVWRSKADNDRFVAEQLHPAFRELSYGSSAGRDGSAGKMAYVEFESEDLYAAAATDSRV